MDFIKYIFSIDCIVVNYLINLNNICNEIYKMDNNNNKTYNDVDNEIVRNILNKKIDYLEIEQEYGYKIACGVKYFINYETTNWSDCIRTCCDLCLHGDHYTNKFELPIKILNYAYRLKVVDWTYNDNTDLTLVCGYDINDTFSQYDVTICESCEDILNDFKVNGKKTCNICNHTSYFIDECYYCKMDGNLCPNCYGTVKDNPELNEWNNCIICNAKQNGQNEQTWITCVDCNADCCKPCMSEYFKPKIQNA